MIDPLTRLAVLHGTDKFGMHDYTPVYHAHFEPLRERPLRVLEIGVGGYGDPRKGGRSLAMWRDYFPQSRIIGFDIAEKRLDLGPRVTVLRGSQVDPGFLAGLVAEHGPFDIIIDDGSHHNDHVWRSFQMLMPALVPGGIYVIEDVQTAFFADFGGSLTLSAPNMLRSFAELMLDLPYGRLAGADWPAITRIDRQHNMIVVTTAARDAAPVRLADDADAGHALDLGRAALWGADGLSPPRIRRLGPDLWQDETALTAALRDLADGEALALAGWPEDSALLTELFAQIDHVERSHVFPHVAPVEPAALVIQLSAFADGILLVRGPNDFPSNMAFHFGSARARRAFEWMYQLFSDPATRPHPHAEALRMMAATLPQVGNAHLVPAIIARLAVIGASDDSSLSMAVDAALTGGSWPDAATIAGHAGTAQPDCPVIAAIGAWCAMRRDGSVAAACRLLGMEGAEGAAAPLLALLARVEDARPVRPTLARPVTALRLDLLTRLRDAAVAELTDLAPDHALLQPAAAPVASGREPAPEV